MFKQTKITADRLREVLSYNPATGEWMWLVGLARRAAAGTIAGCRNRDGYWLIGVDCQLYLAHRLAWLWMTGTWPTEQIDHIDMDKSNNKWDNIRIATPSQNGANVQARTNNTSGSKGICIDKRRHTYNARIMKKGKRHHLGSYIDLSSAIQAYRIAATELFEEYARTN